MYCSALIALKPGNPNQAVVDMGLQLATDFKVQLSAIAVVDEELFASGEAVPLGASAFKVHRDAMRLSQAREEAAAAVAGFQTRCATAGIACEVAQREGRLATEVTRATEAVDLLLAGHTAGTIAHAKDEHSPLATILKHSPRPVLVVPGIAAASGHVVVAYDGSPQASRALQCFATSGLWQKAQVHLLSLANDLNVAHEHAAAAVGYLHAHHLAVESHAKIPEHAIAAEILHLMATVEAELLVMGAFGKSAWREFVFGSVTQTVLKSAQVPVFLAH